MFSIFAANLIITWAVKASATYKACVKFPADAVFSCVTPSCPAAAGCVAAPGFGAHQYTGLNDDTIYQFAYTENGVESYASSYRTQKKTPDAPVIQQQSQN